MEAAHKYMDRDWLKGLTGAELLVLRLRYGKSVEDAVEGELNRRAGVAYGDLPMVPELVETAAPAATAGRGSRRINAA